MVILIQLTRHHILYLINKIQYSYHIIMKYNSTQWPQPTLIVFRIQIRRIVAKCVFISELTINYFRYQEQRI